MTENTPDPANTEPIVPAVNEVADADDLLDWDPEKQGAFADAATAPEDEPATEKWEG